MRVNWDGFLDTLAAWCARHELLAPRLRWVVGVSGGPDSTLLLHAMSDLSQQLDLRWHIHAAHLHHGLRGAEADADAEFVARLAARLGLAWELDRVDIRSQVAEQGGSTEEVARQRRYEFLERVALRVGSDLVVVAHHADDNAETIFHRICRGTGLRGLAGMRDARPIQPGSRVRLLRPLLLHRRTQIEELCRLRGVEFRTDASNQTGEFTRGRVRNTILPLLREQVNPNVSEALLRLGEQAA